jgi:hypothetical protein
MSVYLTTENITNASLASFAGVAPIWRVTDIYFLDFDGPDATGAREMTVTVPVPEVWRCALDICFDLFCARDLV